MAYAADPGGVFESDVHRRVLGHLDPTDKFDAEALAERLDPDEHTPIGAGDADDLDSVLKDLEADGYCSLTADGWKQTKKGQDALAAPVGG